MEDREFLIWLHQRLEVKHGENEGVDYMHKLRAIIRGTPKGKITPNIITHSSLNSLLMEIDKDKIPHTLE